MMDNLDFGNIAIGATIVWFLNLLTVILIKTETILKLIERIKSVVRLDYKNRAKRSDDELRIMKKHEAVARERIRHSFISMRIWRCWWTWNWSDNLEPINIKGYCLGDSVKNILDEIKTFECDHPVDPYLAFPESSKNSETDGESFAELVIVCSQKGSYPHEPERTSFDIPCSVIENHTSDELFIPIISEAILSERDIRIAQTIKKLRSQFWR